MSDKESLKRLAFDLGSDSAGDLSSEGSNIDSKILGLLGIASIVLGVAATSPDLDLDFSFFTPAWLFASALLGYASLLGVSIFTLWPSKWHGPRDPDVLIEQFTDGEYDELLDDLLKFSAEDYRNNFKKLTVKSTGLRICMGLFALELPLVLIWATWSAVD